MLLHFADTRTCRNRIEPISQIFLLPPTDSILVLRRRRSLNISPFQRYLCGIRQRGKERRKKVTVDLKRPPRMRGKTGNGTEKLLDSIQRTTKYNHKLIGGGGRATGARGAGGGLRDTKTNSSLAHGSSNTEFFIQANISSR